MRVGGGGKGGGGERLTASGKPSPKTFSLHASYIPGIRRLYIDT